MAKKPTQTKASLAIGERTFKGLAAAPGIAIGKAYVRFGDDIEVREYAIAKTRISAELKRLADAVDEARQQIRDLQKRARDMRGSAGEELVFLFDAYLGMLDDSRLVRGARQTIEADRINAEAAVQREFKQLAKRFEAMGDA